MPADRKKPASKPGTSLTQPYTQSSLIASMRPLSSSGRPMTGFARPGITSQPRTTSSRMGTARLGSAQQRVSTALRGSRPGTSRPMTTSGRFVRLGTASLASQPGGPFINVEKLDMEKYAGRPHLARVLCDYILYHENNPQCAVMLCRAAVVRLHTPLGPEHSRCRKLNLTFQNSRTAEIYLCRGLVVAATTGNRSLQNVLISGRHKAA
jgi:hypothetical protein